MFGRIVYHLIFLVSIAIVAQSSAIRVGERIDGDSLVLTDNVVKDSRWLRKVTEEKLYIVDIPREITMVRLIDKSTDGNGATVQVLSGGPGWATFSVGFTSRRGSGINYEVEIYAKEHREGIPNEQRFLEDRNA